MKDLLVVQVFASGNKCTHEMRGPLTAYADFDRTGAAYVSIYGADDVLQGAPIAVPLGGRLEISAEGN